MESITQAAEEILVDSLNFRLPGSGQYIMERKSVTYQAEGGNTCSPNAGTRVLRFKLASEGWLDPSTLRVFFDVVNEQGAPLVIRPLSQPSAFFRRLRVTMRGVVIEDIMDYNGVSEMFDILSPPQTRANTRTEGFGFNERLDRIPNANVYLGISDRQTVCFKPLCGILMQTKFLPLRYCPLEFELELAETNEAIVTQGAGASTDEAEQTTFEASIGTQYHLEMCQIKVDVCTLDNALDNSYTSHLLNGRNLNIVYNTFISSIQTITAPDTQINVSRSLTRLKNVFYNTNQNSRSRQNQMVFSRIQFVL
jgi:hypothetical protein